MKQERSQIKIGALLSYANMLIGNLIPLFYTPIMLQLLGQSEYGLYKLATSAASYLTLASMGIGGAVSRYLIKARAEGGQEAEENVFGLFNTIFQVIAVAVCVIGGILAFNLDVFYADALSAAELERMTLLVLILAVNTAVGFSATSHNAAVTSHERFLFVQVMNILSTSVAPIVNLVVLYMGFASIGMVISSLAVNIVIRVAYVFYVRKAMGLRPRYNKMPVGLLKEIFVFSFWIFLGNVVNQLYNATDTMIIGAIPALATVGVAVYNVGATFSNMLSALATAVSNLFAPRANKMVFSGATNEELTDFAIRIGRYQCYIVALVCSGFVAFGKPFISWYAGPDYMDAYWVAVLMMIPTSIPLVQSVALSITLAKNMHQFRSVVYLLIAVINVVGTYILVQSHGIIGAALVTGAASILGQGLLMNWFYRKRVGLDIRRFWRSILRTLWVPVGLCAGVLAVSRFVDFSVLSVFFGGVAVYTAAYCGLHWLFTMDRSEKELVRAMLGHIVKKGNGRGSK